MSPTTTPTPKLSVGPEVRLKFKHRARIYTPKWSQVKVWSHPLFTHHCLGFSVLGFSGRQVRPVRSVFPGDKLSLWLDPYPDGSIRFLGKCSSVQWSDNQIKRHKWFFRSSFLPGHLPAHIEKDLRIKSRGTRQKLQGLHERRQTVAGEVS